MADNHKDKLGGITGLLRKNIDVIYIEQRSNYLVFSDAWTLHCGFNSGWNVAEAINASLSMTARKRAILETRNHKLCNYCAKDNWHSRRIFYNDIYEINYDPIINQEWPEKNYDAFEPIPMIYHKNMKSKIKKEILES